MRSHDHFKTLICSFKITLEHFTQHFINSSCNILEWKVYQEKTCQEQTHCLTCHPLTFVKHLDIVLRLLWHSLTQHIIYITWIFINVISFKLMVYQEKTCHEQTNLTTCHPIIFVKQLHWVLRWPQNVFTQQLIDITWILIYVIFWKLMIYQEKRIQEQTHLPTCDSIKFYNTWIEL